MRWGTEPNPAEKLYGAIVARARLPVFYAEYGIPDTLSGRFAVLSLHLFVLFRRLKEGGVADVAQDLVDQFARDMDTVLREVGVGDLSVPKKMRRLAAASQALLASYEKTFPAGDSAFAAAIAESLPLEPRRARAASQRLATYLRGLTERLAEQSLDRLLRGELHASETEDDDVQGTENGSSEPGGRAPGFDPVRAGR